MGLDTGVDVDRLWEASDLVDEHIGDEIVDAACAAPGRARRRVRPADRARRRARHAPARALRRRPPARDARGAAGDPPRDRLAAARRPDRPDPRLAGPDPRSLRAALRHRRRRVPRRSSRARFGTPAGHDRPDRRARRRRCSRTASALEDDPPTAEDVAPGGRGPRGERGGARPDRALRRGGRVAAADDPRARTRGTTAATTTLEQTREQRIRELVRIVQESGVAEVEIEDEGMRVSVRARRRAPERSRSRRAARATTSSELPVAPGGRRRARSASSRRWSASSTARPSPASPPFVEVGDVVAPGQTLCLLEAMKLFNELKADAGGPRRRDPRRERQAGRVRAAPVRARADRRARRPSDVQPRPRREPRRDRRPGDPRAPRARRRGGRRLLDRRRRRAPRPARRPARSASARRRRPRATSGSRT